MSVRSDKPKEATDAASILAETSSTDTSLAEGNSYCVASPDNPLKRELVVSIRSSLNALCLQKSKATWAPSSDALRNALQQKKFTSLEVRCGPTLNFFSERLSNPFNVNPFGLTIM